MLLFTLILLLCSIINCQSSCPKSMSVNITNGTKSQNGIVFNGTFYDKANYYNESNTIWGCICNIRKCIRKCCVENRKVVNKTCVENTQEFKIEIYNGITLSPIVNMDDFYYVYGKTCKESYVRYSPDSSKDLFLQESGNLFVKNFDVEYKFEDYCIDTFEDETFAYLCEFYEEEITKEQKALLGLGKLKHNY